MNVPDVLDLYRYDEWANARLVGVVKTLPEEAVNRDLGGSFRTLRDVLAHLVSAEWIWLERWRGENPSVLPAWVAAGTVPELIDHLAGVEARRAELLRGLDDAALERSFSFRYISGKEGSHLLRDALVHVVNHSTYHRGQIASMLRLVGAVPPSTDFVVYRAETR